MNLVWALRGELQRSNTNLAVIGGGAAGLTFAAAAAKLGATVHLFESSDLMHLQVGSFHRPLHPEIYTWPEETAYRPVSHLPLLGWTTGTAHDVATEIVSKFRVLEEELKPRLNVHTRTRATLTSILNANKPISVENWQAIVLAVGFGLEDSLTDLPLNSYWRMDALDQSFLEEEEAEDTPIPRL
jgi:phytoene dehydrogenase-like protein